MKLLKYILPLFVCAFAASACDDDWGNDNAAMAHVYYYGPEVWGYDSIKKGNNNVVHYEVAQGETVAIPMQFWCEFVRKYDVVTYYYVAPKPAGEKYYPNATATADVAYAGPELVCGEDYEVVDAQGNKLEPNADGAYDAVAQCQERGAKHLHQGPERTDRVVQRADVRPGVRRDADQSGCRDHDPAQDLRLRGAHLHAELPRDGHHRVEPLPNGGNFSFPPLFSLHRSP